MTDDWKNCIIPNCPNKVCLGASDKLCYPHTLRELIAQQIEAINEMVRVASDEAIEPLGGFNLTTASVAKQEKLLIAWVSSGVNYVNRAWEESALEIIRIINLEE